MGKLKNKVVLLFILIVSLFVFSCSRIPKASSDEFVVYGELMHGEGKLVFLREMDETGMHILDSTIVTENGFYSFRLKVKETSFYLLGLRSTDYAVIIASKGETIDVSGDALKLSNTWIVKGSKESKLYLDYWMASRKQKARLDSLTIIFRNSQETPEYMANRIRLDSVFNSVMEERRDAATKFLHKNPGSLASLLIINSQFSNIPLFNEEHDIVFYKLLDSCLAKSYPQNKLVLGYHLRVNEIENKIKKRIEVKKMLLPGAIMPAIETISIDGQPVSLSSLNGKVVLVNFWEAGNPVCREKNQELYRIYKRIHNKGFEVIEISLDENRDLLRDVIKQDRITWRQINDFDKGYSEIGHRFNIISVPYSFLIDRHGKIAFVNPSFDKLDKKIKLLLKRR
ncbi:MAG: AhpC/TSA family protein [Bacteroidetes bacterium]|nr:AhpC/TSA family protein [Bacteroidota bacterium]